MIRSLRCALPAAGLVLGLSAPTLAGPCTEAIAAFETVVRQTAGDPLLGVTGRESIAADLHRQPTPESIKRATDRAERAFQAVLARAKKLDTENRGAECMQALEDARMIYETQ